MAEKRSVSAVVVPISRNIKYYAVTSTNRYGAESLACQSYTGDNTNISERNSTGYSAQFLSCDGNFVFLDNADVTEGQLLEIETMSGNVLASCFVRIRNRHLSVDVKNIACGHCYLNIINRKGYRHRLGIFSKEIR